MGCNILCVPLHYMLMVNCETTETDIVKNQVKELHPNFLNLHILVIVGDVEYNWIVVGIPKTVHNLLKAVIDIEYNITVHIKMGNEFQITNTYTDFRHEVQQTHTVSCTHI